MRVLLVGNAKYVHVRRWASGLADAGVDVVLFSKTRWEHSGVRCVLDRVPPPSPWRPFRWHTRRSRVLRSVLRTVKPDLIHVQCLGADSIYLDDIGNSPLFVSPWGRDVVQDGAEEPVEQRRKKVDLLRSAKRVVCLSQFLANATIRYGALNPSAVAVQYWGTDLEHFRRTGPLVREPVIGFFKHLLPKYGPVDLLHAFSKVVRQIPTARLVMVGEGSLKEELTELSAGLGISEGIDWIGRVEHSELPTLFERCAITVMPSTVDSETLGVAAIESQAMCVPVVASRVGGVPESVCDGKTGVLIPPRDPNSLADAMVSLLTDHERREAMANAGRQFVAQKFDWKSTIEQMVTLYQEKSTRQLAIASH